MISRLSSGDDVVGQPDLVEEELQARLEPDAVELELDGVLRVDVLTAQRGEVEDDGHAQRLLQVEADLGQGRRAIEREAERPKEDVLDRPAGRGSRRAARALRPDRAASRPRSRTGSSAGSRRSARPESGRSAPPRSCAWSAIRPDAIRPSSTPASSSAPTYDLRIMPRFPRIERRSGREIRRPGRAPNARSPTPNRCGHSTAMPSDRPARIELADG